MGLEDESAGFIWSEIVSAIGLLMSVAAPAVLAESWPPPRAGTFMSRG
jgi:hypothetical protein